jgi:hypothetical protein
MPDGLPLVESVDLMALVVAKIHDVVQTQDETRPKRVVALQLFGGEPISAVSFPATRRGTGALF